MGRGKAPLQTEPASEDSGVSREGASHSPPSGSWTYYGRDFENTQLNADERILGPASVTGLREKWRIELPDGSSSTPAVYAGTVYFGGWDGYAYAADAQTGELRWRRRVAVAVSRGTPLVTEDRVSGTLYARDLRDGTELWNARLPGSPGAGPSVVDGRVYVSAGMDPNGANVTGGGFVSSFGLGAGPLTVWQIPPGAVEPLTAAECREKRHLSIDLRGELASECVDCVCGCDATAAGNCDACWALAPCARLNCSVAAPGDEMRACMKQFCSTKLLTNDLFERAVDAAPCALRCAQPCGF